MDEHEMMRRLDLAREVLSPGLELRPTNAATPWGDSEAAATRLLNEIGRLLLGLKNDLEEGGFDCLLHHAAWTLEGVTLEAIGSAERARVPLYDLETWGWEEGIHGLAAAEGGGVFDWPDAPAGETVGPQEPRPRTV